MSDRTVFGTLSGHLIDLEDVHPDQLVITDIAHALALINRYNGHTPVPYSVAQHSVLVSFACDPGDEQEALMHDAREYLTGDLTRGLKNIPTIHEALGPIDSDIHYWLALKFGFRYAMPASVKLADDRVCATEMRDLFNPPRGNRLLARGSVPLEQRIHPWPWEMAEMAFMHRFIELFGDVS